MKYLIAAVIVGGATLIYSGAHAQNYVHPGNDYSRLTDTPYRRLNQNCLRHWAPEVLMVGSCAKTVEELHDEYLAADKLEPNLPASGAKVSSKCTTKKDGTGYTTECTGTYQETSELPDVPNVRRVRVNRVER